MKEITEKNAFGGAGGFEGLNAKLRKAKRMKLFSTYEDAEKEVKQVPRW